MSKILVVAPATLRMVDNAVEADDPRHNKARTEAKAIEISNTGPVSRP